MDLTCRHQPWGAVTSPLGPAKVLQPERMIVLVLAELEKALRVKGKAKWSAGELGLRSKAINCPPAEKSVATMGHPAKQLQVGWQVGHPDGAIRE